MGEWEDQRERTLKLPCFDRARVCYPQLRPAVNRNICWAHSTQTWCPGKSFRFHTRGSGLSVTFWNLWATGSLVCSAPQLTLSRRVTYPESHFKMWAFLFSHGVQRPRCQIWSPVYSGSFVERKSHPQPGVTLGPHPVQPTVPRVPGTWSP